MLFFAYVAVRSLFRKRKMLCEICYGGKGSMVLPRATAVQQFGRLRSKSVVIDAQVHRLPKSQMLLWESL